MPFSPSDFAWWLWLLFAVGAGVVTAICGGIASVAADDDGGFIVFVFGAAAFIAGLGSVGCILIGAILFVKWVWAG